MTAGDAALERCIAGSVTFLRQRQLPHGEFTTLLGADKALSNPAFDSSPFITSFVVYGLTHHDPNAVEDIVAKAVSFLRSEMEFGGVWRYWSSRNHKHGRLPPDIDDTACISYVLKTAGRFRPNNDWCFRSSRDTGGRFRTWILPTRRNALDPWFAVARTLGASQARRRTRTVPAPDWEDPRFRIMHIDPDDVDPVANANALLYLGERPDTLPAVEFVIDTVLAERPGWSLYYEDRLALYHAAARAFRHSSPRLAAVREHVVSRIAERCTDPGDLNPLQAALAASALLTFDARSPMIATLVQRILEQQRNDAGWNAYAFYNVWGSEELTTALCLEVLVRYNRAEYR